MNKNYLNLLLGFLVVLVLIAVDIEHSVIYLMCYTVLVLIIIYSIDRDYKRQIKFYRREKENEIHEVEGEKDFNYKILNSLIKTMNLPMIFVNKEGTIIFTNQRFRSAFNIKHLRGKYYKDIFKGQLLNVVDQSYVFERKFTAAIAIDDRYYHVEATPIFRDEVVFDGTIILFTDVSQVKELEKMQKTVSF